MRVFSLVHALWIDRQTGRQTDRQTVTSVSSRPVILAVSLRVFSLARALWRHRNTKATRRMRMRTTPAIAQGTMIDRFVPELKQQQQEQALLWLH